MINRPGGLVSRKTPYRGSHISILFTRNLKLVAFMFKTMECCSKEYNIKLVNNMSVLQYKHQQELEQKKADDTEAPEVDKNNWMKTMKNIVLNIKLMKGMRGPHGPMWSNAMSRLLTSWLDMVLT